MTFGTRIARFQTPIMAGALGRGSPAIIVDLRSRHVPVAEQVFHLNNVYAGLHFACPPVPLVPARTDRSTFCSTRLQGHSAQRQKRRSLIGFFVY